MEEYYARTFIKNIIILQEPYRIAKELQHKIYFFKANS